MELNEYSFPPKLIIILLLILSIPTFGGTFMKSIINIIFTVCTILVFTACSFFVNPDDLMKKADTAFENKEFEEFNKLYLKLSEADQEKADEYLSNIKKHKWFTIDQSAPMGDIATIQLIGKEVPDLSDFSNKTILITEKVRSLRTN